MLCKAWLVVLKVKLRWVTCPVQFRSVPGPSCSSCNIFLALRGCVYRMWTSSESPHVDGSVKGKRDFSYQHAAFMLIRVNTPNSWIPVKISYDKHLQHRLSSIFSTPFFCQLIQVSKAKIVSTVSSISGYDYYSSGDRGVLYVISFISDHGSLFDRVSYNG